MPFSFSIFCHHKLFFVLPLVLDLGQADFEGGLPGTRRAAPAKLLSPARRRECIERVQKQTGVSERRACSVLGQHRSTQRCPPKTPEDEERLVADMIALARDYGRYGYRRIAALLRNAGCSAALPLA